MGRVKGSGCGSSGGSSGGGGGSSPDDGEVMDPRCPIKINTDENGVITISTECGGVSFQGIIGKELAEQLAGLEACCEENREKLIALCAEVAEQGTCLETAKADIAALQAALDELGPHTVDTFAGVAAATMGSPAEDDFGNVIEVGNPILTLPDGTIVNLEHTMDTGPDTDTYGQASLTTAAGTDAFGNAYPVGAAILTFPNGDVVCVPDPIVGFDCINDNRVYRYKSGRTQSSYSDYQYYPIVLPPTTPLDATLAEGAVFQESERDITVGDCGRTVIINTIMAFSRQDGFSGTFVPRGQYSRFGVWSNLITGGEDRISGGNNLPLVREGEKEFKDKVQRGWPAGVHQVGYRILMEENNIDSGTFLSGTANMYISYTREKCC